MLPKYKIYDVNVFSLCSTSDAGPLAEDVLNTFDDVCGHGCRKAHLALKVHSYKKKQMQKLLDCWT